MWSVKITGESLSSSFSLGAWLLVRTVAVTVMPLRWNSVLVGWGLDEDDDIIMVSLVFAVALFCFCFVRLRPDAFWFWIFGSFESRTV